jgi:hypothetical protein
VDAQARPLLPDSAVHVALVGLDRLRLGEDLACLLFERAAAIPGRPDDASIPVNAICMIDIMDFWNVRARTVLRSIAEQRLAARRRACAAYRKPE